MRYAFAMLCVLFCAGPARAESWPDALARMPLGTNVARLTRTNCVETMLRGFQSNATVKALIFMPGATDELNFFRRVQAALTNPAPSLLDGIIALTNQSPLRATFREPFLLIHSDEDVLDLAITVKNEAMLEKLKRRSLPAHLIFNDCDWDFMLSALRKPVPAGLSPGYHSQATWHFYRHSFAAWNLTAWETLQATAFAGKTRFTVRRGWVDFEADPRFRRLPKLNRFPE